MSTFNPDSLAEMLAAKSIADITEFTYVRKPWGKEIVIVVPHTAFVFKYIEVDEGKRTSLQYHNEKIETICIFSAGVDAGIEVEGVLRPNGRPILLLPGMTHRAIGPVKFLEVSTDHLDDVVRVDDDYGRKDPGYL